MTQTKVTLNAEALCAVDPHFFLEAPEPSIEQSCMQCTILDDTSRKFLEVQSTSAVLFLFLIYDLQFRKTYTWPSLAQMLWTMLFYPSPSMIMRTTSFRERSLDKQHRAAVRTRAWQLFAARFKNGT